MRQQESMSSRSERITGVTKTRAGKERIKTVMTKLNSLKEFADCAVDQLTNREIRLAEMTAICLSYLTS